MAVVGIRMSTISMEAARRVWMAHREIEEGEKLLAEIRETLKADAGPTPIDGRHRRTYQLGVPAHGGHRLLDVSPRLAGCVIEAHIAEKKRDLVEASLAAKIELEEP